MRIQRLVPTFGAVLLAAACTVNPAPPRAPATPTAARNTGHVSPTRTEEECRSVVANGPSSRDAPATPPQLRMGVVPTLFGAPSDLQGVTLLVRLFVDSHGVVVRDSTKIAPAISSRRYERDFRAAMDRSEYWPAVVEGCAVPAWTSTRVTLGF